MFDSISDGVQGVYESTKQRLDIVYEGKGLLDEGGPGMREKIAIKANARAACTASAIALAQLRDAHEQLLDVSEAMTLATSDPAIKKCMLSDEIIEFNQLAQAYTAHARALDEAIKSLEASGPSPNAMIPTTKPAEVDAATIVSIRGKTPINNPNNRANAVAKEASRIFDEEALTRPRLE
mmetsp:Transcript_7252/g.10831  ORF Transcript_7252/g.10831 Transcript_7252/m.10831 type:complete len:180 (+) Transcript_7252:736-1275(+)